VIIAAGLSTRAAYLPVGYDSGFPDEHAYEDWLCRLDRLVDDHHRLVAGEHVSGSAADTYRHRIQTAHHQFAGRVLTNIKHARDVVANPLLQIYPGRAMTCVFDPAKALCQLHTADGDVRRTPDRATAGPTARTWPTPTATSPTSGPVLRNSRS
jgi:hypothetical protein